jgi:hypothetical protein
MGAAPQSAAKDALRELVGVVTGGDEEGRCGDDAVSLRREHGRGGVGHEGAQVRVEFGDLRGQVLVAAGEAPKGVPGRRGDGVRSCAGASCGEGVDQSVTIEPCPSGSKCLGRCDEKRSDLPRGGDACFHRAASNGEEDTGLLDRAVRRLRDG